MLTGKRGLLWTERRDAFLFILPWLVGFVLFTAGPMLGSLYISLPRWEIVSASVWVGLDQYAPVELDNLTADLNAPKYDVVKRM